MGYAGYSPGGNSRQADQLTPLQRALRALPLASWQGALKTIEELTRGVVRDPGEERLRHIDFSEPSMAVSVAEIPAAVGILKEMGWVDGGNGMVLPLEVRLTHQRDVVGIIEARDYYKKEAEAEHKRQMRARKSAAAARAAAPAAAAAKGGGGGAMGAGGAPAAAAPQRSSAGGGRAAAAGPAGAAAAPAAAAAREAPRVREPPATAAQMPEPKLEELSVRQLKELLSHRGLSAAGCVEKADMVARLRAAPAARIHAGPEAQEARTHLDACLPKPCEKPPHNPDLPKEQRLRQDQPASPSRAEAPAAAPPAAPGQPAGPQGAAARPSATSAGEEQRLRGELRALRQRLAAAEGAAAEAERRVEEAQREAEDARRSAEEAEARVAVREEEELDLAAAIALSLASPPEIRQDSPRPTPPEPFVYIEAEESTCCWL